MNARGPLPTGFFEFIAVAPDGIGADDGGGCNHGQVRQEWGVGFFQGDAHRQPVQGLDGLDSGEGRLGPDSFGVVGVVFVQLAHVRERHRLGVAGRPVGKFEAVAQGEGPDRSIFRRRPRLGQPWFDFEGACLETDQRLEDVHRDLQRLTVLGQRRIQGNGVAASTPDDGLRLGLTDVAADCQKSEQNCNG